MKKFLAIVLALAMILALGVSAFAAPSPTKGEEPVVPVPPRENKEVKNVKITDKDGKEIPGKMIPFENLYEELKKAGFDEATIEAIYNAAKEDYDKAVATEGKKCLKWFWFLPEDPNFVVSAEEPVNLEFDTNATDVEARLNAVALDLLKNEGSHYIWSLPGFGGVGIYGN